MGIYSTTQLKYIIPIISKILCGSVILVTGLSISTWVVSYFIYEKDDEEEEEIIESEHEKYLNFINKDYEIYIDIYKNKKHDYFSNKNKEFIDKLKIVENHETYELPYSYNPTIIFYYDSETDGFYYYCQSDVSCKILNSVCRTYTISNKCIQLFKDEEEIEYISEAIELLMSRFQTHMLKSSMNYLISEPEQEEKEEESNGFINIFYNKKSKKDKQSLKNNKKIELTTNKFVYRGTIDEYKKEFLKNKNNTKDTSYEEYLSQYSK